MPENRHTPDALLLMGRQCPYCPTVLRALESLQQKGEISRLETVVLEEHPEVAAKYGVRSVPWVRIGPFELDGLRSEEELRKWAIRAGTPDGMSMYLSELIAGGNIDKCLEMIHADSHQLRALLMLFTDEDTELNIRIGISAIMESLQGGPELAGIAGDLRKLLTHTAPGVRGDACYYLSLTGLRDTAKWIRPLLQDSDENVREITRDCLAELTPGD
jgi:glutaredoxin